MTVTTAPDATVDDHSPTLTTVDAVVVSGPDPAGLIPLLDTLALQDQAPDRVTILDRTGSAALAAILAEHDLGSRTVVRMRSVDPDASVRSALSAMSTSVTGRDADADEQSDPECDLWWLLPAGTIPESHTLAALLQAHRRSDAVGVVGPKHLDAEDGSRLVSVGISATRSGRVLDTPPPGQADQGQYDQREDVLAVPLAGMLIERSLVTKLRGWERSFGDLGGDLDLGWRAHGLGRRVVLEPRARMRTIPEAAVATASTSARRREARRVALTRAAWWTAPFLALWILVTSVVGSLGLLLLKRPRAAWRELADLGALDPIRGLIARHRTRGRRTVGRRHLRGLFAGAAEVQGLLVDSVHDALVPVRPVAERSADDLPGRSWVRRALSHPGALAVLVSAGVSVAASRSLSGGFLSRISTGVSGGELVAGSASSSALWHGFLDGWTGSGLGGPGQAQPHLAVLAALTWVSEHTIARDALSSPSGATVGALLAAALPLATLTAYISGRVLTPLRWPRAVGALAWATTGVAGASIAQGRLGAVAALVLLPLVGSGLVRIADERGTVTAAFATALGAAVLGAFAPGLLVLVLLAALGLVFVGRGGARWRALSVGVAALALLGPWLRHLAEEPRLILGGPGLTAWGRPEPPVWQLALLHPGGAGSIPFWLTVPIALLGVIGLVLSARMVPAARVRGGGGLSTALGLFALLGLAGTLGASRVVLAEVPQGMPDAGERITAWPGTFMLPLALALIASAVRLCAAIPLRRNVARLWVWFSWPVVAAFTAVALATSGALGWVTFGQALRTWSDPRPPVAVDHARGSVAGRMVFVTATSQGATYRVVGREAGVVARDLPQISVADRDLGLVVAGLLDGTRPQAARTMAASAIGFVALDRQAPDDVERRMDAAAGLTRLAPRGPWEIWRVAPPGAETSGVLAPPRLSVVSPTGEVSVGTTGAHGSTRTEVAVPEGGRLVVAEPSGWSDVAVVRVDGSEVRPTDDPVPTYALPAGPHSLSIDLPGPDRWWHILQGALLALVVFLAVPFGTHESRTRR